MAKITLEILDDGDYEIKADLGSVTISGRINSKVKGKPHSFRWFLDGGSSWHADGRAFSLHLALQAAKAAAETFEDRLKAQGEGTVLVRFADELRQQGAEVSFKQIANAVVTIANDKAGDECIGCGQKLDDQLIIRA